MMVEGDSSLRGRFEANIWGYVFELQSKDFSNIFFCLLVSQLKVSNLRKRVCFCAIYVRYLETKKRKRMYCQWKFCLL